MILKRPMAETLAWAAAILGAIAAAAGLFWSSLYRDPPFWSQQARGIDLATLFLAVPILVASLSLLHRGWIPARSVVIGVLLYLAYNYAIYSTSVVMNRLALIYIAVLGLCVWSFVLFVFYTPDSPTNVLRLDSLLARSVGGFLLVVAGMFALLWLAQIVGSTTTGVPPVDLTRTGLPANPVFALDLALFLPLAVVAAVALFRGGEPAAGFGVPMLFWLFLTSAGVLGGFLFASRAGEQVPIPIAAVISLVGAVALVLAGLALAQARQTPG